MKHDTFRDNIVNDFPDKLMKQRLSAQEEYESGAHTVQFIDNTEYFLLCETSCLRIIEPLIDIGIAKFTAQITTIIQDETDKNRRPLHEVFRPEKLI
jgi:molybdopterin/thiamine biosynthesis adenylyltransferase